MLMADYLTDIGIVIGGALIVAGVTLWSLPAGLVVAGVLLAVACWLTARASLARAVQTPERR